jgi:hypothetical protein
VQYFDPANARLGSKPEITAAQHHCPLHLNKQIFRRLASEQPKGQAMAYTGAMLRGSALELGDGKVAPQAAIE